MKIKAQIKSLLFIAILLGYIFPSLSRADESYRFVVRKTGASPAFIKTIENDATKSMAYCADFIGYKPSGPFYIYIPSDVSQYLKLTEDSAPEWAAGVYLPEKRSIILRPLRENSDPVVFSGIMRHEIAHAVIETMLRGHRTSLPRWLNEGLAMYISNTWESPESWSAKKAYLYTSLKNRTALDFSDLEYDFPIGNLSAQHAYMQSYDLTRFIIERYGKKKLRNLLEELSRGVDPNSAWRSAYSKPLSQLIAEWEAEIRRPGALVFLTNFFAAFDTYIWTIMAVLVIIGAFRVRSHIIRKRKYRDEPGEYDPDNDWDDLDEEWDPDVYGYRPWRPGKKN